jgi:hypothetical protein
MIPATGGAACDFLMRQPPSRRFRAIVFAVFVVSLATGLWRHQMWRDEIQAWLIVRDSHSLAALFHNLRYEGHPALWYLFLAPFGALGRQPEWMQVAQGVAASAALSIILWRGPFSRVEMALLPFGYVMLFEYGVKSRSYMLGILLLVIFLAIYRRGLAHPLPLGIVLGLLANVHALFAIVACAAMIAVTVDRLAPDASRPRFRRTDLAAAAIFLLALAVAWATARQPADSGFAAGWRFDMSFDQATDALRAFAAIVYENAGRRPEWAAWAGLLVVIASLTRARRAPAASAFLAAGALGLIAFFHVKYGPAPWHHGVVFIVLIGAVWLSREAQGGVAAPGLVPRAAFAAILAIQALHGVAATARDLGHPYSNGHAIARFIARKGWPASGVMALDDRTPSTVLGYLGAPSFYYAPAARRGSFIIWDQERLKPIDFDAFFRLAEEVASPTLLDCDPAATAGLPLAHGFVVVATFEGSPTKEDCIVYRKAGGDVSAGGNLIK